MAESNKERQPLTDSQRRKNELIAELARARSGISLHAGQVGYQTDFNRRIKTSLRSSFRLHFGRWLAGALVTGGFISLLPAREKKVYVNPISKVGKTKLAEQAAKPARGGFFISLIKSLIPIIKPILTAFITKQLATLVEGAKSTQKSAERTTEAAAETEQAAAQAA